MKKNILGLALFLSLSSPLYANMSHSAMSSSPATQNIIQEGKKTPLNENYSFVFSFVDKPKMGSTILRIEIFDKQNNKVDNFVVDAAVDMPSMRGHHGSQKTITANASKNYVAPIDFMMRGEWEIALTFKEAHTVVSVGILNLSI
jgi:hypothetical protein